MPNMTEVLLEWDVFYRKIQNKVENSDQHFVNRQPMDGSGGIKARRSISIL